MRGVEEQQGAMFSDVSLDERVPDDHPLHRLRALVNGLLASMNKLFEERYSHTGRPSIPPEQLLRALLLQILFTVRSERQLMEQLDDNLLFRWFVGLSMDAPVWDVTVFTKNRDRLLEGDIAAKVLAAVLAQPRVKALLSDEHFSVDGTLIAAWASMKSFRPKDEERKDEGPTDGGGGAAPAQAGRNAERDFRGEKRTNETHASSTDPDARLYRKGRGKEARLCFLGHVLMENRSALVVDARLTHATGTAEREAALAMLGELRGRHRITLGGDKGYDARGFVEGLRALTVTPHVAQNQTGRRSAVDGRTTRHPGYALSQVVRKRIEEVFGWAKAVAPMRQTRHRGLARVGWQFTLTAAAYNLVRLPKLLAAPA